MIFIIFTTPFVISGIKSWRIYYAEHVVCVEEIMNVYKVSVGKSEGKRPLRN
jgi:hypothetical protein